MRRVRRCHALSIVAVVTIWVGMVFASAPPSTASPSPVASQNPAQRPACDIRGTAGNDLLMGTIEPDVICGFGGDDRIHGLGADDIIFGGPGDDRIWAGGGNDLVVGGRGTDRIGGGLGADVISTGGPDSIRSLAGHTTISNPSWTTLQTGMWSESTGVINNTFTPWTYDYWIGVLLSDAAPFSPTDDIPGLGRWFTETIFGGSGDDLLIGDLGRDLLNGGFGDDLLIGGRGHDVLTGGRGNDILLG